MVSMGDAALAEGNTGRMAAMRGDPQKPVHKGTNQSSMVTL